jgi:hypothetical protein
MTPTCFGLRPSSGSLQLSLAKVILILKHSVRLRRNLLRGGVAAYLSVYCVLCRAQHTIHTLFWDMLLNCRLPDDGRRPKHVETIKL